MDTLNHIRDRVRESDEKDWLIRPSSQRLQVSQRADRSKIEAFKCFIRSEPLIKWLVAVLIMTWIVNLIFSPGQYIKLDTLADVRTSIQIAINLVLSIIGGAIVTLSLMVGYTHVTKPTISKLGKQLKINLFKHKFLLLFISLNAGLLHLILVRDKIGSEYWETIDYTSRLLTVFGVTWELLTAFIIGVIFAFTIVSVVVGFLIFILRASEKKAPAVDIDPPFDHVKNLLKRENHEPFIQNHIIAVTPLKTDPRWMRRLTLTFAFWSIEKLVLYFFRPGFVLDLGSIHFARWFRIPKTDKLIFLSNYDGSWESYLEDFITIANEGQTGVWSNGVGFPSTKFLIFDGASQGVRFKRWVRRQQVESRFWYTRYRDLTTDQIRNNALISEGLAKARTETEARAWVDLFGSRPRPKASMETSEIQSIVFGGMGSLSSAMAIPIDIPVNSSKWRDWIFAGVYGVNPHSDSNGTSTDTASDGQTSTPCKFSFGETVPEDKALIVSFSSDGLKRMGLDKLDLEVGDSPNNTLTSFPNAFVDGMASDERARILGDFDKNAPKHWSWNNDNKTPDALLLLYAKDSSTLDKFAKEQKDYLRNTFHFKIDDKKCIRMQDLPPKNEEITEPFGFRDGISQPIMRGTQNYYRSFDLRHAVEPGEFVLGYPDNRKDYPSTPVVAKDFSDGLLPSLPKAALDRFPDFAAGSDEENRDFGRNGTFLVIRQLEQDVTGFNSFLEDQAEKLNQHYDGIDIDAEWIGAKLVGRWRDGSPLVRFPKAALSTYQQRVETNSSVSTSRQEPKSDEIKVDKPLGINERDNNFLYGKEDPQGLRCPYSAHIRRANPRDSIHPDNKEQLSISNRHRILRRGRPYIETDEKGEKTAEGLMFMCLNSDIERQFEFIQQTWISSSSFHGGEDEIDPIAATMPSSPTSKLKFTIPHPSGPLTLDNMMSYVTVRNGGYFFVPGKCALVYLAKHKE